VARSYGQHCALAHALDLVGERWTLLIARELLAGPRRYTDLADGLVTIPSNLLSRRLREMEGNGLIARRRLSPPAASVVVYELSERGEGLATAVIELARWGMQTLSPTTAGRPLRAHWLVLGLDARFDASAAAGIEESYELLLDGEQAVCFEVSGGDGRARVGHAVDPAVRIAADADTLVALTSGAISGAEAMRRGARIEGEPAAIERMRRILPSAGPQPALAGAPSAEPQPAPAGARGA
jgi:DNA-binding HxlR family transcriptional regulator